MDNKTFLRKHKTGLIFLALYRRQFWLETVTGMFEMLIPKSLGRNIGKNCGEGDFHLQRKIFSS